MPGLQSKIKRDKRAKDGLYCSSSEEDQTSAKYSNGSPTNGDTKLQEPLKVPFNMVDDFIEDENLRVTEKERDNAYGSTN